MVFLLTILHVGYYKKLLTSCQREACNKHPRQHFDFFIVLTIRWMAKKLSLFKLDSCAFFESTDGKALILIF